MSTYAPVRPPNPAIVETTTEIPTDLAEQFLGLYREAFAPLEVLAPARQALTDDEFREEMADPRVVKFVARDGNGDACALLFMATDISVVPWISLPYYAARFPEHHARGAIYYVGAMLVRRERQGGPWAKLVVDAMLRYVAEHHAVMAFDCCGFNNDVIRLPETVARAAHRIAHVETAELDQQRYYAYDMAGLR